MRTIAWLSLVAVSMFGAAMPAFAQGSPTAAPPPAAKASPAAVHASPSPASATPASAPYSRRVKFGAALLVDYTWFKQNQTNLNQVGEQHDQFQLRATRIIATGSFSPGMIYNVSANYNGLDRTPDEPLFGFYDAYVAFNIKSLGKLQVGKQKESFAYEMVALAANLPPLERALLPFYQSRSWGVRLNNTALNQHATWSAGLYQLDKGANQATARISGVPMLSDDGYLHLAADYRYVGASNGLLRFRGKPQSDVASYFVDTSNFAAKYANEVDYELVADRGPVTLQGEYTRAWVNAQEVGNPKFLGYTMMASWVLTGEHRPYDTSVGYATRILPTRPSGAFELVAQFSRVNLNDEGVTGGAMGLGWVGLNWWQTPYWKYGIGYGVAGLTRFDTFGQMHRIQVRLQWVR